MEINCKYYDDENGVCKYLSDWNNHVLHIEYCVKGPCPHFQQKPNTIKIDAKYDIGNQVWFADYIYDEFFPSKLPATIFEINVEITKTQKLIFYWCKIYYDDDTVVEKYEEDMCFSSFEECANWCKERNKQIN